MLNSVCDQSRIEHSVTHKDEAVARYTLDNLPNKVLAAEYKTVLPDEQLLAAEMDRTRKLLESRRAAVTTRRKR